MPSVRKLAPEPLKIAYADARHRVAWHRSPQSRVTRRFVAHHGLTVQAGPFAGMRFPKYAVGRGELVVTQLLGAYEEELHDAFRRAIERRPRLVVDVGASDGYYAVGLARALPGATVHAYEMNAFPARVCEALARENGVRERIVMHGLCTPEELAALPAGEPTFVLCDCEGAEAELMDPRRAPVLAGADLIVELHEFAAPGVRELIERRFAATHEIEIVESRRRMAGEYPQLLRTPRTDHMDWEMGISEFRHSPISWAILTPRA